jgi:c-di-GMP-binding flagellar brake protein YcgR
MAGMAAGGEVAMDSKSNVVAFRKKGVPPPERRRFARIAEPVEAKVRGEDSGGDRFELQTTLANLSAGGLYLLSSRRISPGEKLNVVVRLCQAGRKRIRAPIIAAEVVVRRIDRRDAGTYGVAAELLHHRFL